MRQEIDIPTQDGACRTMLCKPTGDAGPLPAVILYMDAGGYRPILWDHAENLADLGYIVLAPDLFYRQGPYEPKNVTALFADEEARNAWLGERMFPYTPELVVRDTEAFVAYLKTRTDVKPVIGVSGYCMGGGMALRAAAAFPDLVKACASYHGGFLAADLPQSPHLLAPKIKAELFIGVAKNDMTFPEDQEERLVAALKAAGCRYTLEHFDAHHGFTFSDHGAYDSKAAARQWETMTDLFARNLK